MHHKILVRSSRRNITFKYLVNNPEVKGNEMRLNMSNYVMLEEVQYLLVKKERTMTENCDFYEDLVSAELRCQVKERYLTCLLYTSI